MDKCKIQDLNLNETGNNELSNWEQYKMRFVNIAKGIKDWYDLKQSLKKISMFGWKFTHEDIKHIYDEYNNLIFRNRIVLISMI